MRFLRICDNDQKYRQELVLVQTNMQTQEHENNKEINLIEIRARHV